MGAGASAAKPKVAREFAEFIVSPINVANVPKNVILMIGKEALIWLDPESRERVCSWSYTTIMSWGSTGTTFQFKLFTNSEECEVVGTYTKEGKKIEEVLLKEVKKLMEQMEKTCISREEIPSLLGQLHVEDMPSTTKTIEQYCLTRKLTAHQGVQILQMFASADVFDRMELACLLYKTLVNPESFFLLLNCFADDGDRENVCYRLKIPKPGDSVSPQDGARKA